MALSNKSIPFNKGINQNQSALELGSSELYNCVNYELADGEYSGLSLINGFERYDGTDLASDTLVLFHSDGTMVLDGDDLEGGGTATEDGDTDRLAVKAAIIDLPGTGPVLAVFEYQAKLWAIQNNGAVDKIYWVALDGSEVPGWPNSATLNTTTELPDNPNNTYQYSMGRIQSLHSNEEVVVLCNGLNKAQVLHYDGTVTITAVPTTVPVALPTTEFPLVPMIWDQRLFLAYTKGNLFFSAPGLDPTTEAAWTASTYTAGVKYYEDEITNLIVAPSALIVFCEHQIHSLKKVNLDPESGVYYLFETISARSGAIWSTAQRILGLILYCDDRGISTLGATDAYGDFDANAISKNIQKTYLENIDSILGATIDREKNQYKVFSSTGGLIVTFINKEKVKGITTYVYDINTHCGFEGKWLGSEEGYVYKVHKNAESFDCNNIRGQVDTSFFTYNSPSRFKSFKRLLFELQADKGTDLRVQVTFDYQGIHTPATKSEALASKDFFSGDTWGSGIWGTFVWGAAIENQGYHYISGIGTNMSISLSTVDKYHSQSIFHNVQVSYSQKSYDF
jgi:hypothetical protein